MGLLKYFKNKKKREIELTNIELSQQFYSQFITLDDLCFDIGANLGNRTDVFLSIGAKVVAVEPQPSCVKELKKKYKNNPNVIIVPKGLGSKISIMPLSICEKESTIATFSDKWKTGRFKKYSWNETINVEITTLDILISKYGKPIFCKVDVEGFEGEVLRGLTSPIKYLSFEFTKEFFDDAIESMKYLISIGYSEFNYSVGEKFQLASTDWVSMGKIQDIIRNSPDALLWGDIYAKFLL